MMLSYNTCAFMYMVALKRTSYSYICSLNDGLLDVRLNYWTLFNDNSWLHDWIDLSLNHTFAVVEENDFSKLETLGAVLVVEIELDSLRVSVDFRELDYVPGPHSELELTVRDLVPSTFQNVEHMDLYF